MKIKFNNSYCTVTREPDDPHIRRFRPGYVADPNSSLFHAIKTELNRQGGDWIKKRMSKDGHMYGNDTTQYLRERRESNGRQLAIYDGDYALIADAVTKYLRYGHTTLLVINLAGD